MQRCIWTWNVLIVRHCKVGAKIIWTFSDLYFVPVPCNTPLCFNLDRGYYFPLGTSALFVQLNPCTEYSRTVPWTWCASDCDILFFNRTFLWQELSVDKDSSILNCKVIADTSNKKLVRSLNIHKHLYRGTLQFIHYHRWK